MISPLLRCFIVRSGCAQPVVTTMAPEPWSMPNTVCASAAADAQTVSQPDE